MARPVTVETSIDISAPAEAVWRHLVDWDHLDRWMIEGSDYRITSEQTEGVGVSAEAVIKIGGIKTKDTIVITAWEPPTVLEMQHLGWVKGTGRMVCTPKGASTRIDWSETLHPPLGVLGAIGIRMFKPLMRRVFRRDLRLLKSLVEEEGSEIGSGT